MAFTLTHCIPKVMVGTSIAPGVMAWLRDRAMLREIPGGFAGRFS